MYLIEIPQEISPFLGKKLKSLNSTATYKQHGKNHWVKRNSKVASLTPSVTVTVFQKTLWIVLLKYSFWIFKQCIHLDYRHKPALALLGREDRRPRPVKPAKTGRRNGCHQFFQLVQMMTRTQTCTPEKCSSLGPRLFGFFHAVMSQKGKWREDVVMFSFFMAF